MRNPALQVEYHEPELKRFLETHGASYAQRTLLETHTDESDARNAAMSATHVKIITVEYTYTVFRSMKVI